MTLGRRLVNAQPHLVVDFAGDPYGEAASRSRADEIAMRLQGAGGHVYIGDRGDPSQSFYGYVTGQVQHFTGAARLGTNANPYRDQSQGNLETGLPDSPIDDPALRIFAQRLARRTR